NPRLFPTRRSSDLAGAAENAVASTARKESSVRPTDDLLLPGRPLYAVWVSGPVMIITMAFGGSLLTLVYLVYGAAAVTGGGLAGISTDRFGTRRTLLTAIVLLSVCLLTSLSPPGAPPLFWIVLVIWGVLSWSITPPIQSHLVQLSPETAGILQSLNTSALHLGIAFGSSVGSVVIDRASVVRNPMVGACLVLISPATAWVSLRRERG